MGMRRKFVLRGALGLLNISIRAVEFRFKNVSTQIYIGSSNFILQKASQCRQITAVLEYMTSAISTIHICCILKYHSIKQKTILSETY